MIVAVIPELSYRTTRSISEKSVISVDYCVTAKGTPLSKTSAADPVSRISLSASINALVSTAYVSFSLNFLSDITSFHLG